MFNDLQQKYNLYPRIWDLIVYNYAYSWAGNIHSYLQSEGIENTRPYLLAYVELIDKSPSRYGE